MAFISMMTESDIIARWAWEHHPKTGKRLQLLDVGTHDGVLRKYIEIFPGSEYVHFEAADLYTYGVEFVYKHTEWDRHYPIDLNSFPLRVFL